MNNLNINIADDNQKIELEKSIKKIEKNNWRVFYNNQDIKNKQKNQKKV